MQENKVENPKTSIRRKAIYILPNLFTSAALFLGFFSIILSIQGSFRSAVYCIFMAAFMDGIDGKVARLTGTSSEFGIQFDSLSDLTSFGMAPAILMWNWQLHEFGRLGVSISFIILACAALRLARFNVTASITPTSTTQKKFFTGLPSPAAGCALASFVMFAQYLPNFMMPHLENISLFISALIAILMVSRIRYFAFKDLDYAKKFPLRTLVFLLIIFGITFSRPSLFLFIFGFCYILSGIIYTYFYLPFRNKYPKNIL